MIKGQESKGEWGKYDEILDIVKDRLKINQWKGDIPWQRLPNNYKNIPRRLAELETTNPRFRLENNPEIQKIKLRFSKKVWNRLIIDFESAHRIYCYSGKKRKDVKDRIESIQKKADDLANEIQSYELELKDLYEPYSSPGQYLLLDLLATESVVKAFDNLKKESSPKYAQDLICAYYFCLTDRDMQIFLPAFLKLYSSAIQTTDLSEQVKNFQEIMGRKKKKSGLILLILSIISAEWKLNRAPNKETAVIVNALLGLEGKKRVTENAVSQVNIKNRKKNWKE